MGLTIGLAMILGLLGLVVVKGVEPFWPKRVVEITLRAGSEHALQGSLTLGGEIVMQRVKTSHGVSQAGGNADAPREWQLFVGNKDAYGLSFRFVDATDIAAIRHPQDVVRFERIEYGPAIGIPVALETSRNGMISSTNAEFESALRQRIDDSNKRRRAIERIERTEIGTINREMKDLAIERAALERRGVERSEPGSRWEAIAAREAGLQKTYAALAARARELRDQHDDDILVYRLLTGAEMRMPVGGVIDFIYPNQVGNLERLQVFFRNIWVLLSDEPREANTDGGIFPAIFGTFLMTLLMSIAVTPFGVLAAIYLREYATQGPLVRAVRIAINNLAGVPSIVFGVFGLGFFVYFLGGTIDSLLFPDHPSAVFGTGGILWASLTLALMTAPVVIVATEEALASVTRGAREGSLACGASKWQTIQRIVLPAAAPGILTGLILAMARGAGEVAPLMLVGVVKLQRDLPFSLDFPFVHLDQKFMHLGFHVYDLGFQSPDSDAAKPMVFATTLLLIGLVIVLNLMAIVIRERLRRRYATGAF